MIIKLKLNYYHYYKYIETKCNAFYRIMTTMLLTNFFFLVQKKNGRAI